MTETFINLTNHTINEVSQGLTIQPSGIVARIKQSTIKTSEHNGIPIFTSIFNGIEGLPKPVKGTIYIVSALALNAVPADRLDVYSPGNVVRDSEGKVTGCFGLRARA
jgi:hypothetical protein